MVLRQHRNVVSLEITYRPNISASWWMPVDQIVGFAYIPIKSEINFRSDLLVWQLSDMVTWKHYNKSIIYADNITLYIRPMSKLEYTR